MVSRHHHRHAMGASVERGQKIEVKPHGGLRRRGAIEHIPGDHEGVGLCGNEGIEQK